MARFPPLKLSRKNKNPWEPFFKGLLSSCRLTCYFMFLFVIRVPKRPVINTPVVSISVHDNDELLQHTLDKPITVQFRLVSTEERSKPICVFWNHTIL